MAAPDAWEQRWLELLEASQLAAIEATMEDNEQLVKLAMHNALLIRVCWALAERLSTAEMKLAAIAEVVEAAERANRITENRKGN